VDDCCDGVDADCGSIGVDPLVVPEVHVEGCTTKMA
jgi:hypothetical protein